MLLNPRKSKFYKSYFNRKITKNNKTQKNKLIFSKLGLITKQSGIIPAFQIIAIRLLLRRTLKKRAQLFFKIFPNQPTTKKPNEIRLGRGKGSFKYWTYYVKQNNILFEINSQNSKLIIFIINVIKYKLTAKSYILNLKTRWIL